MSTYNIAAAGPSLEYEEAQGSFPSNVIELDSTHYMVAHEGLGLTGYLKILELDRNAWEFTGVTDFQHDAFQSKKHRLFKLSNTKVLCVYRGGGGDGFAVIFTIDNNTWEITAGDLLEFDTVELDSASLEQIDATHFLLMWTGASFYTYAQVLEVDTGTSTVTTAGAKFTVNAGSSFNADSVKIDNEHVIFLYTISHSGRAQVLHINNSTWEVTKVGTPATIASQLNGDGSGSINSISNTQFLITYQTTLSAGNAVVVEVNLSTWDVAIAGSVFEFAYPAFIVATNIENIDANHIMMTYRDANSDGFAVALEVNTETNDVTTIGTPLEFDPVAATWVSSSGIISGTTDKVILAWEGPDNDGFIGVFDVDVPVTEEPAPEVLFSLSGGNVIGYGKQKVKVGKHYVIKPKYYRYINK